MDLDASSRAPFADSAALSRKAIATLMLAMALAGMVCLMAWGPVVLVSHMHQFADQRNWLGAPNGVNVWSHLPLIPVGLWGIWRVSQLPSGETLRWIWAGFFICQLAATLGGMIYHWVPTDATFMWDQVPKSAASTLFALAFLAERVDRRFGAMPAIAVGLAASGLGGLWWLYTLGLGQVGDLRPLMWLELLPVVLVATGAWTLHGHLLSRHDWMRSQISFALAQILDWGDRAVYLASGQMVSGHALRHVALAACCGWVAYRLGGQTDAELPTRSYVLGAPEVSADAMSELTS